MPILAGVAPILGGVVSGIIGSSGASAAGKTIGKTGTQVGNSIDKATAGAIGAGQTGLSDATGSINRGWEQVGNTIGLQSGLYNNNSNLLGSIYNNTGSTLQPYLAAGGQGLAGMQSLLSNYQPFQFDPSSVSKDPAYQFELQQGLGQLQTQAAAAGMLQSGSNEKGIENYAQGLASTFENQDYQQALQKYQTNFSNQLQGLNTLAGYGQNANSQNIQLGLGYGGLNNQLALGYGNQAGQTAGLATTLANAGAQTSLQGNQYIGNIGLQGAVDAGNFYMGGAQGTAAGQMGAANAWAQGVNGVFSGLGGMSSMLGGGGGVPAANTTMGEPGYGTISNMGLGQFGNLYGPGPVGPVG